MKLKVLVFFALAVSFSQIVFGQDISQVPQPERGYLVGPGDEITGKVLGETQFDFVATVDNDGKFQVPFFEKEIFAKCRTEKEIRADVSKLLSKYLKNPQFSVQITERKSRPPATIYGEVVTPQQVVLTRKATLLELLSFAGGIKEEAGGMIQVFRTQQPLCSDGEADSDWRTEKNKKDLEVPSRMYSLDNLRLGKEEANPVIYPGDVIIVQKASPIYITGEVINPQGIYLKEGGMTLREAIAKIGGVRRDAKTKDIKIYRLKGDTKEREVIAANYDLILKGKQEDPMLKPYDIIEVDKAKKTILQSVMEIAIGVGKTAAGSFGNALPTRVLY